MNLSSSVLKKLQKILGKDGLKTNKEELVLHSYDATGKSYLPDAVVFPTSEDQISQVLKLANQEHFYVTPRGSGSGMTGGSVPVNGGVVMVLNRLNRIIKIDSDNFYVKVQPGVITGDLHSAVEEKGLFYPPDPASSSFCTIGGNIGECAGGPRAVKYGVTRDYVLGLRAVLPSGEIIKTGVATSKGVAGYDLARLITGSEGTLAIVSEITLKLIAKPEKVKTLALLFEKIDDAASTVSAIIRESILPRCIEFMDKASINCVKKDIEFELDGNVEALLLIEIDGESAIVDKNFKKLINFCENRNVLNIFCADNENEAAKLWKARKALSPALFKLAPNKINEDIVVPVDKIPEMVKRIELLKKETNLFIASFGHAGDGNIHCNIMYNKQNPIELKQAKKAVDKLFSTVLELGGTITGEHGVGITKMKYLPDEIGETEIQIMKNIKDVFDPKGILNPGKIF
ncbi:MAG: FAD-binding protein, partial [Desulfobacteraceae bacterium]|nr:FAD-binding protein [Desulfobacteraceae bacterium]